MENGLLLKPIQRVRLYENAVEQIQTLILREKCKPGDRLPSERSLAEQFHISRHSLREALRILDVMGLIEIKVGDGIYVKEVDFLPYIESLNLSIFVILLIYFHLPPQKLRNPLLHLLFLPHQV
jgi:DNA-binding FadR family transcriptional regulator